MCGIAGIIHRQLPKMQRQDILGRMNRAQIHRGPDDMGSVHWDETSLGHCRLSIIDTSRDGHQPIANEDESLWLVANGEIYNFENLRNQLKERNHRFRSQTDTETILHLYEDKGLDCVKDLRGMFAFAILDKKSRRLFLSRDRLGIKPLYYARLPQGFIFSSEIKAILATGLIAPSLNFSALDHYLAFGYIPPTETLLEGIQPLLPGHSMVVQEGEINIQRYWDYPCPDQVPFEPREVLTELRCLLEESVNLHRVSDVPLGAFLSGGIDSSAIVGLMSRISNQPVKTFSIGFQEGPKHLNELSYAKIVAERFKTEHQEIMVSGNEVFNNLDDIIMAIDQPSFDGINTYLVSQAAKNGGLTVALSGLGGDELFGGYNIFQFLPRMTPWVKAWRCFPRSVRQMAIRVASLGVANQQRSAKLCRFSDVNDPLSLYAAIRFNLWERERTDLYTHDFLSILRKTTRYLSPLDLLRTFCTSNGNGWQLTTRMEMQNFMTWRLLRDTDAMSMAHALEVRVPFVDHRIVEFICRLPVGWERRWGYPKKILIEALADILPPEILNRPKQGFQFPMGEWMRGPLKSVVEDVLSESSFRARGLFNPAAMQRLYNQFKLGLIPYEVIWQFVILELWMRKWIPTSVSS